VAFSLHAQESSETDAKTPKLPVNKIIATVSVGLAGTAGLAITPDSNILYDGDVGYSGVIPINVSDPQNPVIGNAIGTGSGGANPDTVAGARSYSWDGANRLVQITYDSGTLNSTTLSYDGFGRLVQIQETENGSINLYDYVQNAPMNWTDKAGTDGTPATGGHSSNPIPKKLPPCQQPNNAGGAPTTPGGNGTPVAVPYDPGFVPGVNTPYNGSSPIYDSNGNIIGYNTWNI
jgi:YD repeat-containing protein